MRFRILLAALIVCLSAVCLSAWSQQTITVKLVREFIQSSIQQKLPDAKVAAQLQHMKLSEKLDAQTVEDLQGAGAGPKTVAALKGMMSTTASLTEAPPPPAPKVYVQPDAPPYEEQQKLIREIREYALNYTKSLPDFLCLQVTRRFVDPRGSGTWGGPADTIATKLSYAEQKESYEVLTRNGQLVPKGTDIHSKTLGGTTSSGEFGSMLRYIFEPASDAEIGWERWASLRGRLVYVFHYTVDQSHSKWGIEDGETQREVVPGYRGLIYVDYKTKQILKLTFKSVDIPSDFPIQLAEEELDYDYADISGQKFLLPLRAEVRLNRGSYKNKNDTDFRSYHKYSASSDIVFDSADTPPDDSKTKEQPPK
jgi:hypothetical protein